MDGHKEHREHKYSLFYGVYVFVVANRVRAGRAQQEQLQKNHAMCGKWPAEGHYKAIFGHFRPKKTLFGLKMGFGNDFGAKRALYDNKTNRGKGFALPYSEY